MVNILAEYKICPVCHTINPPTATECECGFRFREGEIVTDRDLARRARRKKLRAAVASCALIAVIAALGILTAAHGVRVLFYILGGAAATLIVAYLILKIIGLVGDRRGQD